MEVALEAPLQPHFIHTTKARLDCDEERPFTPKVYSELSSSMGASSPCHGFVGCNRIPSEDFRTAERRQSTQLGQRCRANIRSNESIFSGKRIFAGTAAKHVEVHERVHWDCRERDHAPPGKAQEFFPGAGHGSSPALQRSEEHTSELQSPI